MILKTRRLFKSRHTHDLQHDAHRIAIPPKYRTRTRTHACVLSGTAAKPIAQQLHVRTAPLAAKTDAKHSLVVCKTRRRRCSSTTTTTRRVNELGARATTRKRPHVVICAGPPEPREPALLCVVSSSIIIIISSVRLASPGSAAQKMPRIIVMIIVIIGGSARVFTNITHARPARSLYFGSSRTAPVREYIYRSKQEAAAPMLAEEARSHARASAS